MAARLPTVLGSPPRSALTLKVLSHVFHWAGRIIGARNSVNSMPFSRDSCTKMVAMLAKVELTALAAFAEDADLLALLEQVFLLAHRHAYPTIPTCDVSEHALIANVDLEHVSIRHAAGCGRPRFGFRGTVARQSSGI
eukprot:7070522-Prymnesium_polylepis.1